MIRLNINVPPHVAGAVVDPEALGGEFAQELLAAGQAEEVEPTVSADPADVALIEVFELDDQVEAASERRRRVLAMIDSLEDAEGKEKVEQALAAVASPGRAFDLFGIVGQNILSGELNAAQAMADRRLDRIEELERKEVAHRADLAEAETDISNLKLQVTADAAEIARLNAALTAAATAAPTDTPPPPAEASGDADGASASSVDPAAPVTAKPAAKSGGAAKAKPANG